MVPYRRLLERQPRLALAAILVYAFSAGCASSPAPSPTPTILPAVTPTASPALRTSRHTSRNTIRHVDREPARDAGSGWLDEPCLVGGRQARERAIRAGLGSMG